MMFFSREYIKIFFVLCVVFPRIQSARRVYFNAANSGPRRKMPSELWREIEQNLREILQMLKDDDDYVINLLLGKGDAPKDSLPSKPKNDIDIFSLLFGGNFSSRESSREGLPVGPPPEKPSSDDPNTLIFLEETSHDSLSDDSSPPETPENFPELPTSDNIARKLPRAPESDSKNNADAKASKIEELQRRIEELKKKCEGLACKAQKLREGQNSGV